MAQSVASDLSWFPAKLQGYVERFFVSGGRYFRRDIASFIDDLDARRVTPLQPVRSTAMDERSARLQASQRNIDRYQKLLQTKLSAIELRFVEQRLSEERFTLAMLQFISGPRSASDIALPDALQ